MTIAKEFTDWQRRSKSDLVRFRVASPALIAIRNHLVSAYGGSSVGIYAVRTVRGGSSNSSHAYGAAMDWSFRGSDRKIADDVISFLVQNSAELGVQAIHDYQNSLIWRANRSHDSNGGWKKQKKSPSGMGQIWADWLHIEVNERQWSDGRPVLEKIKTETRPVLRRGDRGEHVKFVQNTITTKTNQTVKVDGIFGVQTEMAVRNIKAYLSGGKGPITGVVDSEFWKVIDVLNGK